MLRYVVGPGGEPIHRSGEQEISKNPNTSTHKKMLRTGLRLRQLSTSCVRRHAAPAGLGAGKYNVIDHEYDCLVVGAGGAE